MQCQFAAGLLGIPTSSAHCGLRKECGLTSFKTHIYRRKLLYVQRLASLDDITWAKQAYLECKLAKGKTPTKELSKLHINNARLRGQWLSSWSKESNNITQVEATIGKWLSSEPKQTKKVISRINTSMWEIKNRTATPKQVWKVTETFNSQMENDYEPV